MLNSIIYQLLKRLDHYSFCSFRKHWKLRNIIGMLKYGLKFLYDRLKMAFEDDKGLLHFFFYIAHYSCIDLIYESD